MAQKTWGDKTHTDTVEWAGKRYSARVFDEDREQFAAPCASYGTKRCMIEQPHSSYVHLVIGLAEAAGTVEVVR